jgi:hypothetical protein
MNEILALLKSLMPVMLPEVEKELDSVAMPALQNLIANSAASSDVKVIENELAIALQAIADKLLPTLVK